ncbi:MAG: CoA pyrophosphatase, partial [Calditrichales bacterium]
HKRQVSFPGGAYEPGDDNLEKTALRETWEEMGIQPDDLTILGQTDNFLTNTYFMVTPFVAHFKHPYPFKINPDEIDAVIEVPIRHLLHPENFSMREWERDGILWNIHYYDYEDETIWGVTGFLLSNFLSIIFGVTRMDDPLKIR